MTNLTPFYETFYQTINNTWAMLTLFVVIIASVRVAHFVIHKEKIVIYKEFYALLAIVYFLLLYYLLLSTENASSGVNWIPFREISRYEIGSKLFMFNVVGNIVLFIPFGYFVSDYLKAKKTLPILILSLIASLSAELVQYKIGRAFDIDDVILNVVGAIIGFMIYISFQAIKNHLPKALQSNWFYNILAFLVLVGIIVLFGSIWGVRFNG